MFADQLLVDVDAALGDMSHTCEEDIILTSTNDKVSNCDTALKESAELPACMRVAACTPTALVHDVPL